MNRTPVIVLALVVLLLLAGAIAVASRRTSTSIPASSSYTQANTQGSSPDYMPTPDTTNSDATVVPATPSAAVTGMTPSPLGSSSPAATPSK